MHKSFVSQAYTIYLCTRKMDVQKHFTTKIKQKNGNEAYNILGISSPFPS